MEDLIHRIARALERGESVGLASVIEVEGSAPAEAGARIALFAGGEAAGTIGGGAPEAEVLERLRKGERGSVTLTLDPADEEPALLCGGRLEVALERLAPASAAGWVRAAARLARGEEARFAVHALADGELERLVLDEGTSAPAGARIERLRPRPRLIVLGVGHVGRATLEVARAAGLRLAAADDRDRRVAGIEGLEAGLALAPAAAVSAIGPGPADAVLVATRSVALDREALLAAAATPAFYIGLLGSRAKWAALAPELGPQAAARVTCPAGLKLGSRSPGTIAVGIVAQVLGLWHGSLASGKR